MPIGLLRDVPPQAWEAEGACRGHKNPDLWFPERGEANAEAKAICHACPVRRACLDFALTHRIQYGVWGGRSALQRDRINRRWAKERKLEREAASW